MHTDRAAGRTPPGPIRTRGFLRAAAPVAIVAALVAGACSSGAGATMTTASAPAAYAGWPNPGDVGTSGNLIPIIVSSQVVVGKNRFELSLADAQNNLLAAPDRAVQVRFYDLAADPTKPAAQADAKFVWAVPNQRGLYEATVDFPRPGDWGAEVVATKAGEAAQTVRVTFPVLAAGSTPAIGAAAPPSETATLGPGVSVSSISSDPNPDPNFYRLSIKQAIDAHKPFVAVFATPKFCTSRVCGPTLDAVKALSERYGDKVNFIHVEIYTNLSNPGSLQEVPAVAEWGLPSEPWVFVVDANGRVADKFEGVAPTNELAGAIDAVLK